MRRAKKDHLTPKEMDRLLAAALKGAHPTRDFLMFLLAYRHGLRSNELLSLRASHFDLESGVLFVSRSKGSLSTNHPLEPDEVALIRRHMGTTLYSPQHFFLTERGVPFTWSGFYYNVRKAGYRAGLEHVHPHMLRHSCGYKLANDGHDTRLIQAYLGHKDINNTVRYTTVNHERFRGLFKSPTELVQ